MQDFHRIFGSVPVGRLPGTIKGPFKAIRYCLEGQASTMGVQAAALSASMLLETYSRLAQPLKHAAPDGFFE